MKSVLIKSLLKIVKENKQSSSTDRNLINMVVLVPKVLALKRFQENPLTTIDIFVAENSINMSVTLPVIRTICY